VVAIQMRKRRTRATLFFFRCRKTAEVAAANVLGPNRIGPSIPAVKQISVDRLQGEAADDDERVSS